MHGALAATEDIKYSIWRYLLLREPLDPLLLPQFAISTRVCDVRFLAFRAFRALPCYLGTRPQLAVL